MSLYFQFKQGMQIISNFHHIKPAGHAVATAIMNAADAAVHENVKGYDGTHLEKNCTHCIDMAEQLFFELTRGMF